MAAALGDGKGQEAGVSLRVLPPGGLTGAGNTTSLRRKSGVGFGKGKVMPAIQQKKHRNPEVVPDNTIQATCFSVLSIWAVCITIALILLYVYQLGQDFTVFPSTVVVEKPDPGCTLNCSHTCNLIPEHRTYSCSCYHGYKLDADGTHCYDIDECLISGACDHYCDNSEGSFTCSCATGYQLTTDQRMCADTDECAGDNACAELCVNTEASYKCQCNLGYKLDAGLKECSDLDECSVHNGRCQQMCLNTMGSYSCFCISGYSINADQKTCSDVDECSSTNACEQTCINTHGTYTCSCVVGYSLQSDGATCADIDECLIRNGGCAHNCANSVGSFTCSCNSGYQLNNNQLSCSVVSGGGSTTCPAGFLLNTDLGTCDDIDECIWRNGDCQHICVNNVGSFTCLCDQGWEINPDARTCKDIDECAASNGGCDQECTNTLGDYLCTCDTGYMQINATCTDIDECAEATDGCEQSCTNTQGSFSCSCSSGYTLNADGKTCQLSLDVGICEIGWFGTDTGDFDDDYNYGSTGTLLEIQIYTDPYINSIRIRYSGGWSGTHGSNSGTLSSVTLAAGEYIYRVDGKEDTVITQLTFYTNTGASYGPYGTGSTGTFFSASSNGGKLRWIASIDGYTVERLKFFFDCEPT